MVVSFYILRYVQKKTYSRRQVRRHIKFICLPFFNFTLIPMIHDRVSKRQRKTTNFLNGRLQSCSISKFQDKKKKKGKKEKIDR